MKHDNKQQGMYGRLVAMTVVSFVAMYGLMYAMVDALPNVLSNFNQVYMAGLMAGAMVLVELAVMRSMYPDPRKNLAMFGAGALLLTFCWFGIRSQLGVGDRQFMRSMIPHHAAAILMCEEASLNDPEVKKLCEGIRAGQQAEIDWMKLKLTEPERAGSPPGRPSVASNEANGLVRRDPK